MKRLSETVSYILVLSVLLTLYGCATVPYIPPAMPPKVPGVYHEVNRGETLWKISKSYGVDMKEIVRLNKLPDASRINVGQMIFVPYAREKVNTAERFATEDNFIWPIRGRVVSFFGSLKDGIKNKGIDIATQEGAAVLASRSGKVSFREDKFKGYGKTIILDHGDGYATVYAYNSEILVNTGDYVEQGSIIARAGSTGRAKLPSLHFEIKKQHRSENPFYYLP